MDFNILVNDSEVPVQVAPSFFDAPGAQAAAKVTPRHRAGLTMPSSFTSPLGNASPASTQRFPTDQPDVTFVFVSESGYKVRTHHTARLLPGLLQCGAYNPCVPSSCCDTRALVTILACVMMSLRLWCIFMVGFCLSAPLT